MATGEVVELEYSLTCKEYSRYFWSLWRRQSWLGLLLTLVVPISTAIEGYRRNISFLYGLGVGYSLVVILAVFNTYREFQSVCRKHRTVLEAIRKWRFDGEAANVNYEATGTSIRWPWTAISGISDWPGGFLLETAMGHIEYIPERAFTESERRRFLALLHAVGKSPKPRGAKARKAVG